MRPITEQEKQRAKEAAHAYYLQKQLTDYQKYKLDDVWEAHESGYLSALSSSIPSDEVEKKLRKVFGKNIDLINGYCGISLDTKATLKTALTNIMNECLFVLESEYIADQPTA